MCRPISTGDPTLTDTSIPHVSTDDNLKANATDKTAHDAWFRDKVQEALVDTRPTASQEQAMHEAQALINEKRDARRNTP